MEESLGQYLERAKTQKGYSLKDISVMTCISLDYLQALEANDFSKLRGKTIAKSYARWYARCVGLEEAEVMKRFEEAAGSFYQQLEAAKHPHPAPHENSLKSRLDEFVASLKLF